MTEMYARAGLSEARDAEQALGRLLGETGSLWSKHDIDLALFFAHPYYASEFRYLMEQIKIVTGARVLIGCTGQGIIGRTREAEGAPAMSLLVMTLPGARLRPFHIAQPQLAQLETPEDWHAHTRVGPSVPKGWLLFADPYRLDCEALVNGLSAAYPGVPVIGGLASGDPAAQRTQVFLDGEVHDEGAVGVAIGGAVRIKTVVAQGATPIGQPWTITEVEQNVIQTIGQQPAYQLLVETLRALPQEELYRAQRNLLIGLASNEYKDTFGRGDFLIRNLLAANQQTGALAVGALPRVGQTIQFQMRDARTADEELKELLAAAQAELGELQPAAALLCACNGRGTALFAEPDHDIRAILDKWGQLPVAGFFCNGEIGPVGNRNFLHGYTASIALFTPDEEPTETAAGPAE